jgi:hypothetical protein
MLTTRFNSWIDDTLSVILRLARLKISEKARVTAGFFQF